MEKRTGSIFERFYQSRKTLYKCVVVASVLAFMESAARLACSYVFPGFEQTRRFLVGENKSNNLLWNHQPYMGYVNNPGFTDGFGQQINEHGYRGKAVPLRRTPGVARVLALGASTT